MGRIEDIPLSDEALAAASVSDPNAYAALIARYQERLFRYIRRLGSLSGEDQEDILQNAFIKAYRNITSFDPALKFSSWIYRIVHNETVSHFRRQKHNYEPFAESLEDDISLLEQLGHEAKQPEEFDRSLTAEQVRQVLKRLSPEYREVLILKFLEDKNYREISDILKKPEGTVATLIHRAKGQFKKISAEMNIAWN